MTSSAEMLARIRAQRSKYSRNDSKVVKIKEGKTRFRILTQPNDDPIEFGQDVGVHWIKPDENAKPLAVAGSRFVTFGEECQIATLIEKVIANAPDDETIAMAKLWKAPRRVLVNALIRSGDKSEIPAPLELTSTAFDQVMSIYETFFEENGYSPFDPEKGIDLIIERKGKGIDTEYIVNMTSKSNPVSKESLDQRIDLRAFVEKEHFAPGKEQQALTAITRLTGVSLASGALTGPSAAKGGLLTGASGKVVDAGVDDLDDIVETPKKTAAPAKATAKPAPKPADDLDEDLSDLDIDSTLEELDDIKD